MRNKLLIASAGAGKTTFLIKKAINCKGTVLLTTFTKANEEEIKKKFYKLNNGAIPAHVTIRTWFSFLIEHGAKPYQGKLTNKNINGLLLTNEKSGIKYRGKRHPVYYRKTEIDKYYFSKDYNIYSDKLSEFAVECNRISNGCVIDRISTLFKYIFIDEVQDMAGYDLEFIKKLLNTESIIKMAGDPRQVTYHTHFPQKYKKYSNGKTEDFIVDKCGNLYCDIDKTTLRGSWRSNQIICDFANNIFPDEPGFDSLADKVTIHDGVYLVKEKDVNRYLKKYDPIQLRYSKSKKVNPNYKVKSFGGSKGSTHKRVLIYPTSKIEDWLFANKKIDSFETKCKFYVAVTRAKHSVAIVCKNNLETKVLPFFE
jgi:DNA helicase-2/ATP-dependent DNA helicase PcrA